MAKKLQFSVPEPCQQEWDDMSPSNGGRFCSACEKVVVDFSSMTDQQLIAYFQKSTGSVCGRFEKTQLNREMLIPKRGWPWVRYFFQFTLPAFLFSFKASAQSTKTIGRKVAVHTVSEDVTTTILTKPDKDTLKTISGKVINERGEPIPFASVVVKNTKYATAANEEGVFVLKFLHQLPLTLVISSVGLKTVEYEVKNSDSLQILLSMTEPVLSGEVVVVGYAIQRPKTSVPLFNKLKRDTAFSRFSIYPNPVRSNENITIESKKLEKGEYDVQLIGLDGKQVCVKQLVLEIKGGLLRMDLPMLTPGQYAITLIHKATKKAYTEKVTVL